MTWWPASVLDYSVGGMCGSRDLHSMYHCSCGTFIIVGWTIPLPVLDSQASASSYRFSKVLYWRWARNCAWRISRHSRPCLCFPDPQDGRRQVWADGSSHSFRRLSSSYSYLCSRYYKKEDRILIIYDMAWHTMEVFEYLLMGQWCTFAGERPVMEPYILEPAPAQNHDHKVYSNMGTVSFAQLHLPKVNLGISARDSIRNATILTLWCAYCRQTVFLAYLHYVVVDGLGWYCSKVRVMLFQQIMHLGCRGVLILLKMFHDKDAVPIQFELLPVCCQNAARTRSDSLIDTSWPSVDLSSDGLLFTGVTCVRHDSDGFSHAISFSITCFVPLSSYGLGSFHVHKSRVNNACCAVLLLPILMYDCCHFWCRLVPDFRLQSSVLSCVIVLLNARMEYLFLVLSEAVRYFGGVAKISPTTSVSGLWRRASTSRPWTRLQVCGVCITGLTWRKIVAVTSSNIKVW